MFAKVSANSMLLIGWLLVLVSIDLYYYTANDTTVRMGIARGFCPELPNYTVYQRMNFLATEIVSKSVFGYMHAGLFQLLVLVGYVSLLSLPVSVPVTIAYLSYSGYQKFKHHVPVRAPETQLKSWDEVKSGLENFLHPSLLKAVKKSHEKARRKSSNSDIEEIKNVIESAIGKRVVGGKDKSVSLTKSTTIQRGDEK